MIRRKKTLIITLGIMLIMNLLIIAFATSVSIVPVSYSNIGTTYTFGTSLIPDANGATVYVRTRPTTTTSAKLRIRRDGSTLAEGTFPYQTQAPYISAAMTKGKTHTVQVRAVSGRVSGQISGYYSY